MEKIIETEKLTFEYEAADEEGQAVIALSDVSLSFEKGSFTAVLGRNGSGKSTLAKNLNGLFLPTSGRVLVADMDTADDLLIWDIRKIAGMVFQNPDNQLVASIVEDDVAFGPENLGIEPEKIRTRIDQAMKSTGIYEQRLKSPSALSGGQKQRVAIAGVIAMEPECIIFDEPTAMLDPQGRVDVMNIIDRLHSEGITVILITHFMEEACKADRVIIMNDGRVTFDGSPLETFADVKAAKEAQLELPAAVRIAELIRARGIDVPRSLLTMEELSAWICSQKASGSNCRDRRSEDITGGPGADWDTETDENGKENHSYVGPGRGMRMEVKNLCHVYSKGRPDEAVALDDVSFTVEAGEFVGIIGHTGSGKSTLIQHLNGLLKPTSGSIEPEPDKDTRKKIGLVFQYPEYQLFEETVSRDVAFGPANMGLDEEDIRERVRESLELVGLPYEEYAERSPFELSGGQKRRAAIAGVIAMRPELLVLDEPTAGLDPKAHRDILDMVCRIREERGCSVVLVSHNMDDAARLCSRIIVMDHGSIALQGSPEFVFSHADLLKSIGLGLTSGGELIYQIRQNGVSEIKDAMSDQDAADAVYEYLMSRQEN